MLTQIRSIVIKKKQIVPNIFTYIVKGEPIPLAKVVDSPGPHVWDTYKQERFHYIQTLKNLHDAYYPGVHFLEGSHNRRQFVDGPIQLEAIFYMKASVGHRAGTQHSIPPPTFSLFNFLDHALQGVVYKKDCIISSVKLKKIYDDNPRTVIKITRL